MPRSRSSAGFFKLLAACGPPVYAVDESRTIVACNAACQSWLSLSEDELLNQRCEYHAHGEDGAETGRAAAIARALCPPPAALQGTRLQGMLEVVTAAGNLSRRAAEFLPLPMGDGLSHGTLVFVSSDELPPQDLDITSPTSEQLHRQLEQLRRDADRRFVWERLVGVSPAARRARELGRLAVDSAVNVVLFGPPGSGREHLARSIHHARSHQPESPLIPLECPLLDLEQLEVILPRLVRTATKAAPVITVLLLDVDQLTPEPQAALARHLQAHRGILRALATSRQSLVSLAKAGNAHDELASMLEIIAIELPPLTGRLVDLPYLAQAFVEELNASGGRPRGGFTPDAMDLLALHRWPGNLDELAAMVRLAWAAAEGPLITPADLPAPIRLAADAALHPRRPEESIRLDSFLVEIETEVLKRALRRARGNKAKAARLLGISRARLHRRVHELGLVEKGPGGT